MKVCQYCDTESPDSATVCESCGGKEFKHKCDNCGNIYDEGTFCPVCGVKAGAKAKKCPKCGNEYYSNACPDCGYTNGNGYSYMADDVPAYMPSEPVKQRKTWLWVLGWIFMFPLPLTIIVWKNQKLQTWLKVLIIAAAWILYFLVGLESS